MSQTQGVPLRHELRFKTGSDLATCRCGQWALADRTAKPLPENSVKRNYDLHKKLSQGEHGTASATVNTKTKRGSASQKEP